MKRVFTEAQGPRYPKGKVADYPLTTWRSFFPGYEKFTRSVEDEPDPVRAVPLKLPVRGKGKQQEANHG